MSALPKMPVFVADFLAETLNLTLEQQGAYLRLLFFMWKRRWRSIADDEREIARILGCTRHRWRTKLRPVLVDFFEAFAGDDGQPRLRQKRLVEVMDDVESKVKKASENGTGNRKKIANPERDFDGHHDRGNDEQNASTRAGDRDRQSQRDPDSISKNGVDPSGGSAASPPPLPKRGPAVKAAVRQQWEMKLTRFLKATTPAEAEPFLVKLMELPENNPERRRLCNDVDARMRAAGWDDMREWKRGNGIAA